MAEPVNSPVDAMEEWPVESPCIKVCRLDLDDRCYGCGRTLDDIRRWSTMTLEERQAVNQRIGFRGHKRA